MSRVDRLDAPTTRNLRSVLGHFATGVVVVSTPGENGHGMTANAFTSLSLDPPLVLVCVAETSRMRTAIDQASTFGVSVLSAGQLGAAQWFADRERPPGAGQFATFAHRRGRHTGAPLLTGAGAWLECAVQTRYAGGDHAIVLGRVLAAELGDGRAAGPLIFHAGVFTAGPTVGAPSTRAAREPGEGRAGPDRPATTRPASRETA